MYLCEGNTKCFLFLTLQFVAKQTNKQTYKQKTNKTNKQIKQNKKQIMKMKQQQQRNIEIIRQKQSKKERNPSRKDCSNLFCRHAKL